MTEPNEINRIIKDPNDPRYPCQLGVLCDDCGTEWVGDFLVTDDDTHARRLEIVRNHVRENEGWDCGAAGDFCPDCGFWVCPDEAHRRTGIVEWRGDVAYCMEDGCGRNSAPAVTADETPGSPA